MTPAAIGKEMERILTPTSFKKEALLLLIDVVIC